MANTHLDWRLQTQHTTVVRHDGLSQGGVHALFRAGFRRWLVSTLSAELVLALLQSQVVQAGHHVQTWHSQRLTGRWGQDVVGSQHQDASFGLSLCGQWQVDCHLVTVEVGVESLTCQRMQLNSLALHQDRLERLDS